MTTTFALIGVHGYGRTHLQSLEPLIATGAAELVAVADPRGPEGAELLPAGTPCYPDLAALQAEHQPEVVIIATPIHTHEPLALAALGAGSHVVLEKPPAASLAGFENVLEASYRADRVVQVGFQSFGSRALPHVAQLLAQGAVGEVEAWGGIGTWLRRRSYYQRARWAGRRTLDGVPVVDGVVTNPLAHAVATGLLIAGVRRAEEVDSVEVELFRANQIEADDTSAVRVVATNGQRLAFGLTLCSPADAPPEVLVRGSSGELRLRYTRDELLIAPGDGAPSVTEYERDGVLANMVAHLREGAPLFAPLVDTGAFMTVLEAVRTAAEPTPVDPAFVTLVGDGEEQHRVIEDIDYWCSQVATQGLLFSELGAPFARTED